MARSVDKRVNPLKILVFDIETAPGEVYAFSPKIRWAPHSQWRRFPFMLQWSAAWLHGGGVMADSVTPQEVRDRDDSRVVESIVALIHEADIVLAHNGDGFDVPWVRGRAWLNDGTPLGPVSTIDTKKLSAKDFGLTHNNLDHLIREKLGTKKIKTDFSWWVDIIEYAEAGDDETAQKRLNRMLRYCKKDTRELRDLFKTMIPHVHRLPRLVDVVDETTMICPFCGSTSLQKRGKKRTAAYTYQRYQCNECGRYPSDRKNDGTHKTGLRPT